MKIQIALFVSLVITLVKIVIVLHPVLALNVILLMTKENLNWFKLMLFLELIYMSVLVQEIIII